MAFNSLRSVIVKQIVTEARIQASSQVRLGSAAALNLGTAKLIGDPDIVESNIFVWGTNQGTWGSYKITNQYKPS